VYIYIYIYIYIYNENNPKCEFSNTWVKHWVSKSWGANLKNYKFNRDQFA
jgi:hypothetical protein